MPGLRLRPNGDVPHLTVLATMPTVGRLSDFSLVECTPLKVRGQYGPRGAPDARAAAHNYTRGSTVRYNARSPRLDGQCGSDGPAPRCAELARLVYGEVDHEEALSAGTADHAGAGTALLRHAWTTAAGHLGTAASWPRPGPVLPAPPLIMPVSQRTWMDTTDPPHARAAKLLKHMNFTEKTMMLSVHDSEDDAMGFYIGLVETSRHLGMPWLRMDQDFRPTRPGANTNWPSALTIGATFGRNMARLWGKSMGKEIAGVQAPKYVIQRVNL
jgi:hypothetical protein